MDDHARLLEGIRLGQDLPAGEAARRGAVGLDLRHRAGLPAPGVVDEEFGVDAEQFIQQLRILPLVGLGDRAARHVAQGVEAVGLELGGDAAPDAPEVRQGAVRPVFAAVAQLVQLGNAHAVRVGRAVLRLDVHRDFAEVEIRADARRGGDARLREHLADELACEIVRRELVGLEVVRGVDEDLVDGIDLDVLRRDVAQVDAVDLAADLHVTCHAGRRHNVFQLQGRVAQQRGMEMALAAEAAPGSLRAAVGVDAAHRLHDLEEPRAPGDAVTLQRGRHRQADGLLRPGRVRYDEMRVQRVQPHRHALRRGVERLQVDGDIGSGRGFHYCKISRFFRIFGKTNTQPLCSELPLSDPG